MRLQRLEIAGFKSFSDRSELAFDEGVTAIVGPNGCGKSNVADAITWVLGEQSAKSLRGDKMEDVIFNGSDARKPTGSAEVRLRLSDVTTLPSAVGGESLELPMNGNGGGPGTNGHGHISAREVEVIRRLYRSGESEYLIDGQLCRLRDVHELLMDTGLGAKAYAIIEQGKIGLILSSRPADRRQLIEEAAGITKYKSRRRAAELKLEAAQQNLTRIDDIVFEVEKQRGTLKRQAAKARRFQKLRDEMRRWEKVLFAGRYRELGATIETTRGRLAAARARESGASGRVAELETTLSRLRIEVAEADARATRARDAAHGRELEAQRRHQQVELDKQQVAGLESRTLEMDAEIGMLEARREPGRVALEERRAAASAADADRAQASETLAAEQESYQTAGRELEGLEHDLEAARSAVYHAVTGVTTLRHALEHAASARERVSESLARLDVEDGDLSVEREALAAARLAAQDARGQAIESLDGARARRAAEEAALSAARLEHEACARDLRTREQELAGLSARLRSLEELDASRAGFGDAARVVLAQANGAVNQLGAVADYLDVDMRYERAVEAALGELLQHVVVPTHAHASAGLELVRQHDAGRCGFLVLEGDGAETPAPWVGEGVQPLSSVARATGTHGEAVARALFPNAWIAESYEEALSAAARTGGIVATPRGDVARGAHLVTGGTTKESRGILATKGEIRELRERLATDRASAASVGERVAGLEAAIAVAQRAIESAIHDVHHYEKALVGHDAQLARAAEEATRVGRKAELLALDRRRAEQEGSALDQRQAEARDAIAALEVQQREADERFNAAQSRLASARAANEDLSHRVSEAKAIHARLTERSSGLAAEVSRLEEAARELDERVAHLHRERAQKDDQRTTLLAAIQEGLRLFDEDVRALEQLKAAVHEAEAAAMAGHAAADAQEAEIREARAALDAIRAEAAELEVGRATAESDLAHLAAQCAELVQASLDDVLAEVEQMERDGAAVPDARAITAEEPEEPTDEAGDAIAAAMPEVETAVPVEAREMEREAPVEPPASLTAEEAITALKGKIDRLGPVNMMAIEQHEELEARHLFLTTQRKDLVDSIAQTGEAIRRIDETSKTRFREAFAAINKNFQQTFSTLFGGGRAGITLLDESDPLESGLDIVASPPGKRLQSVQLLSGGEKALTAIALMFAIFQYKPSPFCLLDEIDAPLDDANIGRFVEMLKGMLHHTQFILITHNRKTMEIADRLYGVTMEEPGVSKLISVRLN
jgi:chromosome segregation protein